MEPSQLHLTMPPVDLVCFNMISPSFLCIGMSFTVAPPDTITSHSSTTFTVPPFHPFISRMVKTTFLAAVEAGVCISDLGDRCKENGLKLCYPVV